MVNICQSVQLVRVSAMYFRTSGTWTKNCGNTFPPNTTNRYQVFLCLVLPSWFPSLYISTSKKIGHNNNPMLFDSFSICGRVLETWKYRLAEDAIEQGNSMDAAELYAKQISELNVKEEDTGLLSLNAGLATSKPAKSIREYLNLSRKTTTNLPRYKPRHSMLWGIFITKKPMPFWPAKC